MLRALWTGLIVALLTLGLAGLLVLSERQARPNEAAPPAPEWCWPAP